MEKNKQKNNLRNKKIIAIVGPTASGKSSLAIKLAKKFKGEIISVDSRQVFRNMDIGTGKVSKKERKAIPHHLLDVVNPKKRFSVIQYKKMALNAIEKIIKKGKLPILCGGTGFYFQAVIDGIIIPEVEPDWQLRKKLEQKSVKELYSILKKIDANRAKNIDKNNSRRLIRAIEIAKKIGRVPPLKKEPLPYPVLIIGVKKEKEELKKLIRKRLLKRLKSGMISEVKRLKKSGLSWKRLDEFGLEYRWIAKFLKKELNYSQMIERLQKEIENFAKRQIVWFKKDKRIRWIKNQKEAEKVIKVFIKS